jgi:diguanylate cyclase (GGDEF)-like protein
MNFLQGITTPDALRDRTTAIEEGLRAACHALGAQAAALTLLGKHDPVRHTLCRGGELVTQTVERPTEGLVRNALKESKLLVVNEPSLDNRFVPDDQPGNIPVRNAITAPVQLRTQNIGVLSCYNLPDETLETPATANSVYLLSTCIGLALENARLARTVRRVAVTDDLTQVYNYRFLRSALRREMKRATRFRQTFVLLMVDVDHLKEYNDREGHLRGSYLLRDLARILSRQVRGMDLLAKYGGDEFTVILPQTPREGGIAVAERIRASVEDHIFYHCEPGGMTVSVGVAIFPEDAIQPTALIGAADTALFAAKQRGRNQVTEATGLILRGEMTA